MIANIYTIPLTPNAIILDGGLGFSMPLLDLKDRAMDGPELAYQAAVDFGIDVGQLEYILTLTPAERLKRHEAALVLVLAAREAGIRFYGFDPRSPEAP